MGKAKNKDFQKIKFKVGKKIAKNTNDTKATFKTKTLVLKQQFKDEKIQIGLIPHRNTTLKVKNFVLLNPFFVENLF